VSAERLHRIVDAIADVYLLDAGDETLRPEPVSVRDGIERAVGAAAPLLEAKANSLLTDLHSAPSTIRADGSALRQIVLGLLATAAEIGEAGCIEVRARSVGVFYDDTDCQDPLLLVTVSHPAARVPTEELARLCQGPPPPEGEDSYQSPVPVGPGFPMAKRLVEMQGGRIWAENGNGTGMSLSFILPVDASRTSGARHAGWSAPRGERGEDGFVD
jgi:K+-sensing histidine kinase KdpD